MTLRNTDMRSTKLNCWKTMPISARMVRMSVDHAPVLNEVLRDLDPPSVGVAGHEPRDMAHQGRFSGTGRADERDHFAGLDVQADPVKPLSA